MRHAFNYFARVIVVPALILGSPVLAAEQGQSRAAKQVPVSVYQVASGGHWSRGKQEGFYRVVVLAGGVEHVSHRLYIQWLRVDARSQGYELLRSVSVREINARPGQVLDVKTAFGKFNAFRVMVTAKSRGGKARRFVIIASGVGTYSVQPR